MDGTTSKTKKQNLKWAASVLKAKAGISSKMAVPKKIAQKSRAKLRKKGQNIGGDDALQSRIASIDAERRQRQRHHLVKQLQQAAKKAKTFLVRRLLRKAGEAGAAAGNSDTPAAARSRNGRRCCRRCRG